MNYQEMWYTLKEKLIKEHEDLKKTERTGAGTTAVRKVMDDMAKIEVREAAKHKMLSNSKCGESPGTVGNKQEEPEKPEDSQKGNGKLKDIFGEKFVDDIPTLEQAMKGRKDTVIIIDGNMKVPEHLEQEARDRNIKLARTLYGEVKVSSGFPFPFIPGIPF